MQKCYNCPSIYLSTELSTLCPTCEDTQRRLNEKLSERVERSVMSFAQVCHWVLSGERPRRIRAAWRIG